MSNPDYLALAETYLQTGIQYYEQKEYHDALFYFEQVLEYNNNHKAALYYKGILFELGLGVQKNETVAFECYKKGGDIGHGECGYRLGLMYLDGRGVPKDSSSAFEWFKFAADIGSSAAQIQISNFFETGTVVNHDCHIAMSWLLKTANDGKITKKSEEAKRLYYYIANFYYKGHDDFPVDFGRAKYWYEKAAELNHPDATLCLGFMYEKGEDVEIDYSKALDWYSKAALHEKTSSSAFFNIGLLYQHGHGDFQQNPNTAFIYFLQAAMVGHTKSQFKVALIYQNGESVEKDFQQAYNWYTASEDNKKYDLAQYMIGHLYRDGYGDFKQDFGLAFHWYQLAAKQGHKLAENELGILYHNGTGVEKNYHQALYWYTKTPSNSQDPTTQYNIAKLYLYGYGDFEINTTKAVEWLQKAAEQGDSDSQFKLGTMYHNGTYVSKDYFAANKWYLKVMEKTEDDLALLNIAKLYYYGYLDFKKDESVALYYYQLAAELGNVSAMLQIGIMYQSGIGVPKDCKVALSWYLKVDDSYKDAYLAYYNIGDIYYHGSNVSRNYDEAFKWFMKAAIKGDSESQYMVGTMYADGSGTTRDINKAIEWYQKSSDKGYPNAKYALALLYHSGDNGVKIDEPLALKLYLEVLEKVELGDAYYNVGYMYEMGAGNLSVDYKKAMEYYLKADKLGCRTATEAIGLLYLNGYGVERDYARAFQWFNHAVEEGSVSAIVELGRMYFYGQFVEKDHKVAAKFFQKALDQGHETNSIQVYLDKIKIGTSGFANMPIVSPPHLIENRIISTKFEISSTMYNDGSSSQQIQQELKGLIKEQSDQESLSSQKRIEFLEEQLRLQSLEMEKLLRMNSPVNYHAQAPSGIATRVEPFHFVAPSPMTVENNIPNMTVGGETIYQPVYSVEPRHEFNFRNNASNVKIESHKSLDINDDLGPLSTKTAYNMCPEQVDLLSEQSTTSNVMPPLVRDDGTTSTLSILEELSLISFDTTTTALNTKPDIKDDERVYANKPNEVSVAIFNKPNSLDDDLFVSSQQGDHNKSSMTFNDDTDDFLIETFVRKTNINYKVSQSSNTTDRSQTNA